MRVLIPQSTNWSWPRRGLSSDLMGGAFDDFEHIVNSFTRPTYANSVSFQPSYDVSETKEHYLVSFDMPGVKKENVKIEVQGNQLTISGERQREIKSNDSDATLHHERTYGKFERTFVLPVTINAEKIEAHYEDGVLNVALPKSGGSKGRTIQIQTGQGGFFSKFFGDSKKEDANKPKEVTGS